LIIQPTLSKPESKELLERLERQSAANIKEQLGYGRKNYPIYANGVVKRVNDLFISYNN